MNTVNGKNSNGNIVVPLVVLNMIKAKVNVKNMNKNMNKAKVNVKNMNINKANGKNSNSNDENVGGIDHESNGSIRNKTKASGKCDSTFANSNVNDKGNGNEKY
jgi:hypothetical protein